MIWHYLPRLALASLRARWLGASITVISIALAAMLLISTGRMAGSLRDSFADSAPGADLIVGARTSPSHLLLHSALGIGSATDTMRQSSADWIAALPGVAWTVPMATGDSHRRFTVIGTTDAFFRHLRSGSDNPLRFVRGRPFREHGDLVLGSRVARDLGYDLGASVLIEHGSGDVPHHEEHSDRPFRVVGILEPTGTPADRSLYVSLDDLDVLHERERTQLNLADIRFRSAEEVLQAYRERASHERRITALLVGMKDPGEALALRPMIDQWQGAPLTAILPDVTLTELWGVLETAEKVLYAISVLTLVIVGLIILAGLLAGLNERRREIVLLRAIGLGRPGILLLASMETAILVALGLAIGVLLAWAVSTVMAQFAAARFDLVLEPFTLHWSDAQLASFLLLGAGVITTAVTLVISNQAIGNGLSPRI